MPKSPEIKCSRCHKAVGKDFVYMDDIKMIFHPRCYRHHKADIRNKDLLDLRKKAINNPLQGGTGSKK